MPQVTLTGYLLCRTLDEAKHVEALLPEHIRLTRLEPGCLLFEVRRCEAEPARFTVSEAFVDRAAFNAHQARTASSAWARGTKGIPRDYQVEEREG